MTSALAAKAAISHSGCTRFSISHIAAALVFRSTKAIRPTLSTSLATVVAIRAARRVDREGAKPLKRTISDYRSARSGESDDMMERSSGARFDTHCPGCDYARPPPAPADARARAVLRAAGHAVQRIPSHQGARGPRPSRRSRHLSDRARRRRCPTCAFSAALRPPLVRRVPIGPSAVKVLLDALMLLTIARRALAGGYDAIHSHEEMGLIGVWLAQAAGHPAPLRHALEPAAAAQQLQVQRVVGTARRFRRGRDAE